MPFGGLRYIGAEDPVPPGQVEAKIGIDQRGMDRMVDPVHVRRHHKQPQYPVDPRRDIDIAVVEHGRGVEQHLEDHHRHQGWPQHQDGGELDQHGEDDFEGMKPGAGGDIVVEVGVMHPVQAPKQRDGMDHHMLEVDDEIQRNHGDDHRRQEGHFVVMEQPPAPPLGQGGDTNRRHRKQQAQHQAVEKHQGQITAPTPRLGDSQRTARGQNLPNRHEGKDAEEETQPNGQLVPENPLVPVHRSHST